MKRFTKISAVFMTFLMCMNLFSNVSFASEINPSETSEEYAVEENSDAAAEVTEEEIWEETVTEENLPESDGEGTVEEFTIEDGVLKKYNGTVYGVTVVIPEGVTEIGEEAFLWKQMVSGVVFPSTLKKIDKCAFYQCGRLTHVEFNEGLEEIDDSAFLDCPIEELHFPDSVKYIGSRAFKGAKMKSVNIPKSLEAVHIQALGPRSIFDECPNLEEVVFPEGIENFENYFTCIPGIKKIVVPSSVNKIVSFAFFECPDLEEIEFKGQLERIDDSAFRNCPNLKKVTFNIKKDIDEEAFYKCTALTDVEMGDFMTALGKAAFSDCTSLKEIVIPGPVSEIPEDAFKNCENLTDVYLPSSVKTISDTAFPESENLTVHCSKGSYAETFAAAKGYKLAEYNNTIRVNFSAKYSEKHVNITWEAVDGAQKYEVFRIDEKNNYTSIARDISSLAFEMDDPDFSKNNKYIVRAYKDGKYWDFLPEDEAYPSRLVKKNIGDMEIGKISEYYFGQVYNGKEKKPTVYIYDGDEQLQKDRDFTVTYKDNINAGTATVTITGCGDYQGVETQTFVIEPKSLRNTDIIVEEIPAQKYTGGNIKPKVTVKDTYIKIINGNPVDEYILLKEGIDYTASYSGDLISVGWAELTLTGKGNYKNYKYITYQIVKGNGPSEPKNLEAVNPSKKGLSDGKISGVTTKMEYSTKSDFSSNVKACTATEITGLKAGTYYIRVKETDNFEAGKAAKIVLQEGPESITGTVTLKGTAKYGSKLTATVSNSNASSFKYQWKRGNDIISGAASSTYKLAKDDIGKTITCVVTDADGKFIDSITSKKTAVVSKADAPEAPAGIESAAVSKFGAKDGKITGVTTKMEYSAKEDFSSDVTACISTEITGLKAGTYYVRIKETSTTKAGKAKMVTVEEGKPVEGINEVDGKKYIYQEGVLKTGWIKLSGKWYYGNPSDGVIAVSWKKIDNKWYYFNSDGVMLTGWQQIDSKYYYFTSGGNMITGWKQIGKTWYYFKTSGEMATGWQKISGKWFYFKSSGAMTAGWTKIDGKQYFFKTDGTMATGWVQYGGKYYYMMSSGIMKTGWLQLDGKWYYFNTDGSMVTGNKKIGSKTYKFTSSGVCQNP